MLHVGYFRRIWKTLNIPLNIIKVGMYVETGQMGFRMDAGVSNRRRKAVLQLQLFDTKKIHITRQLYNTNFRNKWRHEAKG